MKTGSFVFDKKYGTNILRKHKVRFVLIPEMDLSNSKQCKVCRYNCANNRAPGESVARVYDFGYKKIICFFYFKEQIVSF